MPIVEAVRDHPAQVGDSVPSFVLHSSLDYQTTCRCFATWDTDTLGVIKSSSRTGSDCVWLKTRCWGGRDEKIWLGLGDLLEIAPGEP